MCNDSDHTICFLRLRSLVILSVSLLVIAGCENDEKEIREFTRKKMGVDEAKKIEINIAVNEKYPEGKQLFLDSIAICL